MATNLLPGVGEGAGVSGPQILEVRSVLRLGRDLLVFGTVECRFGSHHGNLRVFKLVYLNHLAALGRRCGQPGQQQGVFSPSCNSSIARLKRFSFVASCFAIVVQHTHSLRWISVSEFQCSTNFSFLIALRSSSVMLWKAVLSVIIIILLSNYTMRVIRLKVGLWVFADEYAKI